MARPHVDPLRTLTPEERGWLTRLSRARAEPAAHVARATALLAVADGVSDTEAERARILAEAQRTPDRTTDGTVTWSLTTLQRALRRAPDGLPKVSTYTIWQALHGAGLTWQRDRSWCTTGRVIRKRTSGPVEVTDVDAAPQKT